jgi:cytochrome b
MLLEEVLDCAYRNSQRKSQEKGVATTIHLQELRRTRADRHLSHEPQGTLVHTATGFSSEVSYVSPDAQLMQLCAKMGTEKNPRKIAALISQLVRLLTEEQNTIKAKIVANLSRLITPPSW